MKKSLILSVIMLVLTACGEPVNQPQEQPTTEPASEPTAEKPTIDYSQINKAQVADYIVKISDAVDKTKTINLQDPVAVHDWSKVMNGLHQEGLQYGENLFSEPYGRCAVLGIYAQSYWQDLHTGDKNKTAQDMLQQFNDNKKACTEVLQGLP